MRSRHGCSIAEINRHGYAIIAPPPTERLYSGDRLLLLGEDDQIRRARQDLEMMQAPGEREFRETLLETVEVTGGPEWLWHR